jgi:hypothetical protein
VVSNPEVLGAFCYEVESSWGEDVTTFSTRRIATVGRPQLTLNHSSEPAGRMEQYRSAGSPHVKMTMGGEVTLTLDLHGHGSTMVGSPTISAPEAFMGAAIGAVELSASASTTLTGGTAASPTTTASGTFDAGGLCRVGALNDGDGNGQMYSILTHSTTTLNLRGALDAAPANGAVLYPVVQIYPYTSPTANVAVTGIRFLWQSANLCYELHGCWLKSYTLNNLNTGGRPQITMTFGVSWWRESTATFPSAVSTDTFNPSPVAAGSFNVQVTSGGSATNRNVRSIRDFTVTITRNVAELKGPGGVNAAQTTIGARHLGDDVEVSWTEDVDAATTTPVLAGYWSSGSSYHIEYTFSTTDGSAGGISFPKVCPSGDKPVQMSSDGVNRIMLTGSAYSSDTATNALTLAPFVLGSA